MKCIFPRPQCNSSLSPPARGAWIEMLVSPGLFRRCSCRPPHGGRGLKYVLVAVLGYYYIVAPRTGGVD